jgi:DNA mismatch repair protein MutL
LPAVKSGQETPARLTALRERLRALYGDEQKLLSVDYSTQSSQPGEAGEPAKLSSFHIWGFIGAPGVSRSTREDQHLFVNRRPVENRGLNFALLEGYHTALMKGRYPVCCLFLEIDPAAVDVNIHPAKREVKFHQEGEVRRCVAQAVRQTLLNFHGSERQVQSPISTTENVPPASNPDIVIGPAAPHAPSTVRPIEQKPLPNFPAGLRPTPEAMPGRSAQPSLRMGFAPQSDVARAESIPSARPGTSITSSPSSTELTKLTQLTPSPEPLLKVPLRLVGVIGKLYVVLESDRGLVLLDQHAAHERILFEQMLSRLEKSDQAPSQRLLLPETVELSARDANFLREQLPLLLRLGVGLSEFGERTFLLDALPPFVKATDPRRFVLELVDELKAAGQQVNTLRLGEHTVAKTVCRHAVKANDPLAGPELENLVEDLRCCAMPYTCPHGRPTLIEMNFRELEKKFGRVQ